MMFGLRASFVKLVKSSQMKMCNPLAQFSHKAPAKFGQPTEWTHPHIIGRGEVNHGIKKEEFHKRRERLVDQLLRFNFSASTNYLNNLKHQIRPS